MATTVAVLSIPGEVATTDKYPLVRLGFMANELCKRLVDNLFETDLNMLIAIYKIRSTPNYCHDSELEKVGAFFKVIRGMNSHENKDTTVFRKCDCDIREFSDNASTKLRICSHRKQR